METLPEIPKRRRSALDPFRRAVVGGLAVLLPPLLTIVIILWVANTVNSYLLEPLVSGTRRVLVRHYMGDIRPVERISPDLVRDGSDANALRPFLRMVDDQVVPASYFEYLEGLGVRPLPQTSEEVVRLYVERRFLSPYVVIPTFLCVFVLVLYLLGKFLAAGVGRIFWVQFEKLIHRLPLIRNVYSSVKQVTDFVFTDQELEYTRVVAVEYPRKGIWTIAFATGESFTEIRDLAGEPVLSLLIPTSPMPFTGFTISVKKSETVDLDISLDQAFQFIVSCGVVASPKMITDAVAGK